MLPEACMNMIHTCKWSWCLPPGVTNRKRKEAPLQSLGKKSFPSSGNLYGSLFQNALQEAGRLPEKKTWLGSILKVPGEVTCFRCFMHSTEEELKAPASDAAVRHKSNSRLVRLYEQRGRQEAATDFTWGERENRSRWLINTADTFIQCNIRT